MPPGSAWTANNQPLRAQSPVAGITHKNLPLDSEGNITLVIAPHVAFLPGIDEQPNSASTPVVPAPDGIFTGLANGYSPAYYAALAVDSSATFTGPVYATTINATNTGYSSTIGNKTVAATPLLPFKFSLPGAVMTNDNTEGAIAGLKYTPFRIVGMHATLTSSSSTVELNGTVTGTDFADLSVNQESQFYVNSAGRILADTDTGSVSGIAKADGTVVKIGEFIAKTARRNQISMVNEIGSAWEATSVPQSGVHAMFQHQLPIFNGTTATPAWSSGNPDAAADALDNLGSVFLKHPGCAFQITAANAGDSFELGVRIVVEYSPLPTGNLGFLYQESRFGTSVSMDYSRMSSIPPFALMNGNFKGTSMYKRRGTSTVPAFSEQASTILMTLLRNVPECNRVYEIYDKIEDITTTSVELIGMGDIPGLVEKGSVKSKALPHANAVMPASVARPKPRQRAKRGGGKGRGGGGPAKKRRGGGGPYTGKKVYQTPLKTSGRRSGNG